MQQAQLKLEIVLVQQQLVKFNEPSTGNSITAGSINIHDNTATINCLDFGGPLSATGNVSFENNISASANCVINQSTISVTNGIITFKNNSASAAAIFNSSFGVIAATGSTGSIDILFNCGSSGLHNDGSVSTIDGDITIVDTTLAANSPTTTGSGSIVTPGTLTLNGDLAVDASQNIAFTNSAVCTVDTVAAIKVPAAKTITGFTASSGTLYQQIGGNCPETNVVIDNNVVLTGKLTISGTSTLVIIGDLTITGDENNFLAIADGATLIVGGDLIVDGDTNQYTMSLPGNITVTGAFEVKYCGVTTSAVIQVDIESTSIISANTVNIHHNAAMQFKGTLYATNNIDIKNNNSTGTNSINNDGTVLSTNGNISLTNNDSIANAIFNTGTIRTDSGSITIDSNVAGSGATVLYNTDLLEATTGIFVTNNNSPANVVFNNGYLDGGTQISYCGNTGSFTWGTSNITPGLITC